MLGLLNSVSLKWRPDFLRIQRTSQSPSRKISMEPMTPLHRYWCLSIGGSMGLSIPQGFKKVFDGWQKDRIKLCSSAGRGARWSRFYQDIVSTKSSHASTCHYFSKLVYLKCPPKTHLGSISLLPFQHWGRSSEPSRLLFETAVLLLLQSSSVGVRRSKSWTEWLPVH